METLKRKSVIKFLKWLKKNRAVEVSDSGKHTKIKCIHTGESFPLPTSHSTMNKHILKNFLNWCKENEICSREEFERFL